MSRPMYDLKIRRIADKLLTNRAVDLRSRGWSYGQRPVVQGLIINGACSLADKSRDWSGCRVGDHTMGSAIGGTFKPQSRWIVRFCNRTIVGDFIRQRLVARDFYHPPENAVVGCDCFLGGRMTDRTTGHAIVLNWNILIARPVVDNRTTCCCDLRLLERLVMETHDWSHDQLYSISQEICTRFLLCCALLWLYIDWFSHIHQAYFTGTVAI